MALQLNKTLKGGVTATECYAKIIEVGYLPQFRPRITVGTRVIVGFYFNKAARDEDNTQYLNREEYVIEDTSIELRENQYAYLKTLPDFEGAVDL